MIQLASKARSAVLWNAGFKIFRDGLQFASMLVLTRLLPTDYYGQFSFICSVVGFISIFSLNSFIAYLVQVKDDEHAHFQDHFTAGGVLNLGMLVITNLFALGLLWHPKFAVVSPFLHVMSLSFLFEWPCNLRVKMIERDLDWQKLRSLHAIGLIASSAVGIFMAWANMKTYALIVPQFLINIPFIYDLFIRQRWRPTWEFNWVTYRQSFNFGINRIGSGLISKGRELLEAGVFASMLTWDSLGVFSRATGLAALLCLNIASQFTYAIYPVLTRLSNEDGKAARAGSLVMQVVAWITIPLATSFVMLSGSLVPFIYGERWVDVTSLIPYTMVLGVILAHFHAAYTLLLARPGQVRLCLWADFLILVGTSASLLWALPHGVPSYLTGLVLSHIFVLFVLGYLLKCEGSIMLRRVATSITSAAVAAGVSGLVLHYAGGDFAISAGRRFWVVAAWGLAYAGIYTIVLRVVFKNQLESLLPYLPFPNLLHSIFVIQR